MFDKFGSLDNFLQQIAGEVDLSEEPSLFSLDEPINLNSEKVSNVFKGLACTFLQKDDGKVISDSNYLNPQMFLKVRNMSPIYKTMKRI